MLPDCPSGTVLFDDPEAVSAHMVSEHKAQPKHCPLCLQTLAEDGSGSWLHFTRHMEEIALAALPPVAKSDMDSATDSDLNSNPDLNNVAGTEPSRESLENPHPASQSQWSGLLNIPQNPSRPLRRVPILARLDYCQKRI